MAEYWPTTPYFFQFHRLYLTSFFNMDLKECSIYQHLQQLKIFVFNTVFQAIDYNIFIGISGKYINKIYGSKAYKVYLALVVKFIFSAHCFFTFTSSSLRMDYFQFQFVTDLSILISYYCFKINTLLTVLAQAANLRQWVLIPPFSSFLLPLIFHNLLCLYVSNYLLQFVNKFYSNLLGFQV